ncbi:shikimate dehydrogenase [Gordonibacter sp. An230]|uniref:shikimate dehydrogenase family protein n=1 Tax=Gordonibacter sp. An230 TaxID=1965592 RepID=UPI000B3688FC|nr:shikimate dehydrogenase [Gordonibacter sp. An230]OUO89001.1 shikimate dehydrogenase [Gordonibacter sp. An230]
MGERLFLLGHPVAHSKSPAMYNAAYERLGLPWRYGLADLGTEEEARSFLAAEDFLSANVTTPYKPLAFEAATHTAATAKLSRGANLLVRKKGALIGYNTDGQGCVAYLERVGFGFAGKRVAVCGTGPTALSILHASAVAGADVCLLVGRDKERTRGVLEGYVERFGLLANATIDLPAALPHHRSFRAAYERPAFKFGSYATSSKALGSADLVVNATPLGMHEGDLAPFDTGLLHPGQTVLDAVYGHGETALMRGAREAGCTAFDGAGMLVGQAVATVGIVCDLAEAELSVTQDELFSLMAGAAGFDVA